MVNLLQVQSLIHQNMELNTIMQDEWLRLCMVASVAQSRSAMSTLGCVKKGVAAFFYN